MQDFYSNKAVQEKPQINGLNYVYIFNHLSLCYLNFNIFHNKLFKTL